MVNIDGLTTETVNEATKHIDEMDALGIVTLINQEDKKVAEAIEKELPNVAKAVDAVSVTCNGGSQMAAEAQISIAPVVGPEVISGSTRMKAGTAQKMVLNMISTGVMVRVGKVYQNYMVHVQPTNEKLVVRAERMISEITGADRDTAARALKESKMAVPEAIVMVSAGCDLERAKEVLQQADGRVRAAIELAKQ